MPRAPHLLEENQYYHVLIKGMQPLFQSSEDYQQYIQLFKICHKHHGREFSLIHFCLLPNQIHLLIHLIDRASFSQFIRVQNQRYFYYYQRKYTFKGHLFSGRYQTLPINGEDQLLECGRYIERQPVQRGLADAPAQYPWSSYAYYAGADCPLVIEPSPVYLQLSSQQQKRTQLYSSYLDLIRPYDRLLDQVFA